MKKKNYSEALILRINELYHDREHEYYSHRHRDIFVIETKRWEEYSQKYIKRQASITILDYGTGAGFVPSITAKYLKNIDLQVCVDISNDMLKECASNLKNLNTACELKFAKSDGLMIPAEKNSIDIITMNSVLHHLPDINAFAIECFRVLKSNGLIIIAHEPNSNTKLPVFYQFFINFLTIFSNPKLVIDKIVERSVIIESLLRKLTGLLSKNYRFRNEMLNEIANILLKENLINRKLRGTEIQDCVDFQVKRGGIKKNDIINDFQKFKVIECTTKSFINTNFELLQNTVNKKLENKFPENGQSLGFVLQKRE